MAIYRIEAALRPGLRDSAGEGMARDLADVGLERVREVRTARVYLVEGGFDRAGAERAAKELFADKVADLWAVDAPVLDESASDLVALEIVRKPGVMDPVQESAMRGLGLLGLEVNSVRTARRVLVHGEHSADELVAAARKTVANEVIEEIIVGRPDPTPPHPVRYEFKEGHVPIRDAPDDELMRISRERVLSLNIAEMHTIRDHFRELGRDPRDVELETLAQTWSEHCVHKTLRGRIRMDGELIDNLLKNTIMRVTDELAKPWCLSVFKDNAGVISFDDEWAICFKVETHNHPSAIEPYGGAGTGIGGVIRDPMGTGMGAKPVANTDIFCFAPVDYPREKLPPGVLHPKRIMKGVVAGVRDYGNRMGIPTVNGAVCFDERYLGNPLVYCGNIGLLRRAVMGRDAVEKYPKTGDRVFVVGGRTGRDGIHGATFSSVELTEESETVSGGAVQIGNAIEEKRMVDVILKARDEGLYDAITDCGAGGLSSAVGEMGAELGAVVELSRVPLKYQGLNYTEIWISEAQERMVLAVPPEKAKALKELFASEDVDATDIGEFTNDRRLRLHYDGHEVCDIPMDFLHDGYPRLEREARWTAPAGAGSAVDADSVSKDWASDLLRLLGTPDIASKEWVIRQYDHEVQGGSVLKPLVGPREGPSDGAALCPVLG
ncbi:MAG: phosphoribosylformylglycinamidine synthase subunit PurS, partial [Planctomycetota bacterium]